jgi:hypothetical protein
MAFQLRSTGCCGVLEIVDISRVKTSADVITGILRTLRENTWSWGQPKPFIYFTSVPPAERRKGDHATMEGGRQGDYGTELADYIEQEGLGTVIRTIEPRKNYTGNPIKLWIWTDINYPELQKRYQNWYAPSAPPQAIDTILSTSDTFTVTGN